MHIHTYRGEVDNPDNKGSTPLHIAATYGHEQALELLIGKNANLFALDNHGRTAAKVAAFYQKVDCCRFLDTLGVRWEVQNHELVTKLQKKAMKDLQKRTRKGSESGTRTPASYDYSTAPSGVSGSPRRATRPPRPSSGGPTGRKGAKLSLQDALRQNFELRTTDSTENIGDDGLGASKSATELNYPSSGSSTFRTVHRPNQGPLINALSGLPLTIEADDAKNLPEAIVAGSNSNGHRLPTMQLIESQATSFKNDSPLSTFLHSLDLVDYVESLHKEKLDLEALAMCREEDLTSIGLPLGPRKKILNAILKRRRIIDSPSKKMTESEF